MHPTSPSEPVAAGGRVVVVGVGADGWEGLGGSARRRLAAAAVVLGSARQLELLPTPPPGSQRREVVDSPYLASLEALLADHLAAHEGEVCVLASGDPLVSGVGGTLVARLGADRVEVLPAVSSVALARARMGWPAESCVVVSAVGRDLHLVIRELAPGRRLLVLGADEQTAGELARLLDGLGLGASRLSVLADLGSEAETRRDGEARSWSGTTPRLCVVAVEVRGPWALGWSAGLPDDAFEHDGQLTKRDLRASALARLAPQPGQLLWDVGAGAGSVGIEWARAHPTCRTYAVEADADRAARVARNARRLGVPDVRVVEGRAPEALVDLPAPDAVFVGGGATTPGLLERCLSALRPGGRLVVHGVTLETEARLATAYAEHGGELVRLQVERAAPIGDLTGWTPARAVTQWTLTRDREAPGPLTP